MRYGKILIKTLLMKFCLASLDLLCHQFHCSLGIYFLARCKYLNIVIEHFELSTPYVWLDVNSQTWWSVSSLFRLWNDRSSEENVLVLLRHSWRQLRLQHILHGICLKSRLGCQEALLDFASSFAFFDPPPVWNISELVCL